MLENILRSLNNFSFPILSYTRIFSKGFEVARADVASEIIFQKARDLIFSFKISRLYTLQRKIEEA